MLGKVLGEETRNLTLHDAFHRRLETPNEQFLGERALINEKLDS